MQNINSQYVRLLLSLRNEGDYLVTRGAGVKSLFGYDFGKVHFPLVTVRKTAWKTALKEMEWFMSGKEECPEGVLRDVWWKGQLNSDNGLKWGYPSQLRHSPCPDGYFDQVAWLKEEIKNHPTSRRLLLTTWNSGAMAFFTDYNKNPMAPTPCHLIMNQFQVRDGKLHMNAFYRSTDAILGLPHNLVQHKALQLYFAHHAEVKPAPYYKLYLNDVHYYDHPDHNAFVEWLADPRKVREMLFTENEPELVYLPTSDEFRAGDFHLTGILSEPAYTKKIERTL
jgi:thymidylate synthase